MRSRTTLSLVILIFICAFGACSRKIATDAPAAGALATNAATPGATTRMVERRNLDVAGFHLLNDFIRADVRERLDREPTDPDGLGTLQTQVEPVQSDETEPTPAGESEELLNGEDMGTVAQNLEKMKFSWAKKKFGDAVAADPNVGGVVVLYADEEFYDLGRLQNFLEEGKERMIAESGIEGARMLVVYGGYRGNAQVELWIVGIGDIMPAFKPDEREPAGDAKEY